jgi:regulatory protein
VSDASSAYLTGLKMLARRELSEKQVRQRLLQDGYSSEAVGEAVDRLRAERAIDDERVAAVIARTQTTVRRRGAIRVRREIEQAGISSSVARRVVEETFEAIDSSALLEQTLTKRLHGRQHIVDQKELQRLHRYLIAQGFEADAVMKALNTRCTPMNRL